MSRTLSKNRTGSQRIRGEKQELAILPLSFLANSITYSLSLGNMDKHYWSYLRQKEKRRMHWLKSDDVKHALV